MKSAKKSAWSMVPLGQLLVQSEERTEIQPDRRYRQVTVRLWGAGVVLRNEISGTRIAAKKQSMVRPGQFILSRIDARNGAFGLVPESLCGAVVSNDFPAFDVNRQRLEPSFLAWMSKTQDFVDLCRAASEGTTNRVRLKVDRFLQMPIPLPPLDEQHRIVARIEELAALIEEAQALRVKAREEAEALVGAESSQQFESIAASNRIVSIGKTFVFRNDLIRPTDGKSGDLRFIGLQHIESHTGKRLGEDRLLAEQLEGRKFQFSPGEIVYGYLRPYLNKVWIADCEGVCSVDQYVLQPKPEMVDTGYIAHFMRSPTFLRQAIALTHNLILPRLRTALLKGIPIPLPSLSEQRRIVAYLDGLQAQVDELVTLQAATQAELDALLPSVLDRAFRGEL